MFIYRYKKPAQRIIFLFCCFFWAVKIQAQIPTHNRYAYRDAAAKKKSEEFKRTTDEALRKSSENKTLSPSSNPSSSQRSSTATVTKAASSFDDFYQLGINEMNWGSPAVAIGYFEKAISLNALHVQSYFSIGKIKSKLEDHKAAVTYFTKALLIDAGYDLALEGRANARMQLGEYTAAISDYDKAIAIAPHYLNYYLRAISKHNSKDYNGAIADFTISIDTLDALQDDFDTEKRGGKAKPKKSKKVNAAKEYREVEDYPAYINSFYYRGLSKHRLLDYKAAIEDYDHAATIKNNDPYVFFLRGNVKSDMGQLNEAIVEYNKALEVDPAYSNAIKALEIAKSKTSAANTTGTFQSSYDRGIALQDDRKYSQTIGEFDKAIQFNSASARAFIERGYCKQKLKLFAEAKNDYDKAILIDPTIEDAFYRRGSCSIALGQPKEGINDLLKVTQINPLREQAFNLLGKTYMSLGDPNNAIVNFTNAINLKPYPTTFCNRGEAKSSSGLKDYPSAIADFSKTIELSPDHYVAYNLRAVAKREMKDFEGAIADLEKAIQILPTYDPAIANLKITKQLKEEKKKKK